MQLPFRILRWLATRPAAIAMLVVVAGRTWGSWRQRSRTRTQRRQAPLPSLYDRIPGASTVPRRRVGVRTVPLDRIVGTLRHPSQNTADFLPLPGLRGRNWESRWQRIQRAIDRLEMLPPIDLVQVGDDYYVEDGHNRVAAALRAGAVEIDADVTQLLLPGQRPSERGWIDASSVVGGEALRQAGRGRHSRTVEQRSASDEMSRSDLIRGEEGPP